MPTTLHTSRPRVILLMAAAGLALCSAVSSARAEVLVLRCIYGPLTHVGNGPVKAGEKFTRDDVFEIDLAARRAVGASVMGRGNWSRVVVRGAEIRLSNGDPSACEVEGRRGEEVVINRYSGASRRSDCLGSGSHWITLHWSGTCERAKRAF